MQSRAGTSAKWGVSEQNARKPPFSWPTGNVRDPENKHLYVLLPRNCFTLVPALEKG